MVAAGGRRPDQLALLRPALIALHAERGYPELTHAELLHRVGLDPAELDPDLADLESSFCAVLEIERDEFFAYVDRTIAVATGWPERLRAVAYALLRHLRADPARAHFLTVEVPRTGERANLIWTETILAPLLDLIDEGRDHPSASPNVSRATASAIAGGLFSRTISPPAAASSGSSPSSSRSPSSPTSAPRPPLPSSARRRPLTPTGQLRPPSAVGERGGAPIPESGMAIRPPAVPSSSPRHPKNELGSCPAIVPSVAAEEPESGTPIGDELGPLPAGRHGYTPEEVAHNQRERLLAAVAQVVDERGYSAVTVTHITEAASVSRRVFYDNFADKQACFIAAFEIVVEHLREIMIEAVRDEPDWPQQILAALRALLDFLADEPLPARLVLVDPVTADAEVADRFRAALTSFAPYLRAGRAQRPNAPELPDSTEDSLLGALASLLSRALATRRPLDVPRLTSELAEFVLTPYIGATEAGRLAREAA